MRQAAANERPTGGHAGPRGDAGRRAERASGISEHEKVEASCTFMAPGWEREGSLIWAPTPLPPTAPGMCSAR